MGIVSNKREYEALLRASMMRGRVNICLAAPFTDGARREVHEIFSRKDTLECRARSLASLPNLAANDIATTIWAGRLYRDDFFHVAPQRLKLKMLEHLHEVNAFIAQPFVAQLLGNRSLPRRLRVLAWTEGVLRPHDHCRRTGTLVTQAYAASHEARLEQANARQFRKSGQVEQLSDVLDFLIAYPDEDGPTRFDMERTLRGLELSWQIVSWLVAHSLQKILTY